MDDPPPLDDAGAAAARARWLAEIALAVEAAHEAAERLVVSGHNVAEVRELKARLEAIRSEIEELRRGGWRAPVQELGSKRIDLDPEGKP